MKKKLLKFILCIYLFLAIYAPPFFKFNILYILSGISFLYLVKDRQIKIYVNKKVRMIWLSLSIILFIKIFIGLCFGDQELINNRIIVLYQWFGLIPMQLIVCLSIKKFAKKNRINNDNLLNLCINAGVIQGILVLLSFLFPEIRDYFLEMMRNNLNKERLYGEQGIIGYRAYGFAASLIDTFGYGMGLILGVFVLSKNKKNIFDLVKISLCVLAIILNSRTGIIIFFLIFPTKILNFIFFKRKKSILKKLLKEFLMYTVTLILVLYLINISNLKDWIVYKWIIGGFVSILNFITGVKGEYRLGSMQNTFFTANFWKLPEDFLGILIGKGHSIYGTKKILGIASDVGYINYIWIFGILGLVFLLYLVYLFFYSGIKTYTVKKEVIIFLALAFYIMMFKGNIISYNSGTFITIFILILYMVDNKERVVFNKNVRKR